MTKVKKRVRKPKPPGVQNIQQARYLAKQKADNWIRPYCTIPGEYREEFNNVIEDLCTRGLWDRRAKAECKAFGSQLTKFYFHRREHDCDMFLMGDINANWKFGLFPSRASLETAWAELTSEQREAVIFETTQFGVLI